MPGLQPKRMEEIVIEKPVPRKAHGLEPLRRQGEPDSSLPSPGKLMQVRPPLPLRPRAREFHSRFEEKIAPQIRLFHLFLILQFSDGTL